MTWAGNGHYQPDPKHCQSRRTLSGIRRRHLALALGATHGAQAQFPAVVQLSALDGTNGFVLDGVTAGDYSGRAVSAAGDINGDGFDDLLIGAYGADPSGGYTGSSYVVFGGVTGAGLVPEVSIAPASLDYGDVALGAQVIEMLIVENTGTGTLEPGAITISGAQAGDFSIAINNCAGAQLGSGESCVIDIGFTPAAPGIRRATLRLESNAATSPDSVDLIGTNDVVFFDGFEDR